MPPLLGGLTLFVPAVTRAGQKVGVSGRVIPKRGGGGGDLYAVLNIAVPATLTDREKALFEQLRETSRFNPRARFS